MQCLRIYPRVRSWAGDVGFPGYGRLRWRGDDDAETIQAAITVENALTANALTANALTANALTANALTANALTANALTANALTANGLRDPLAREFLKYVVSCALDEDDSVSFKIDGKRYEFRGALGLAPEWGRSHGSCDGDCQRWVSACVLARVDAAGVKRMISIRGEQPRAAPGGQRAAPLHRPRGDVFRQPVHPRPAALHVPVAGQDRQRAGVRRFARPTAR